MAPYCSPECAKADWPTHKVECAQKAMEQRLLKAELKAEDAGELERPKRVRGIKSRGSQEEAGKRVMRLLDRAGIKIRTDNHHEAITLLDQALTIIPGYTETTAMKGLILCMNGNFTDGIKCMEEGREYARRWHLINGTRLETQTEYLYNLSKAYLERSAPGDIDRAIDTLTEHLVVNPTCSKAPMMLMSASLVKAQGPSEEKLLASTFGASRSAQRFMEEQRCKAEGSSTHEARMAAAASAIDFDHFESLAKAAVEEAMGCVGKRG